MLLVFVSFSLSSNVFTVFMVFKVLARAMGEQKEIKEIQNGKEESNFSYLQMV